MSITDENTTHKSLPLPHATNDLSVDVERLRQTIQSLDSYINGLETEIAAKAAGTHTHEIDQISGLQAIINDLQNQSAPDVLADMSDVDTAGVLNGWALFRQAGKWIGKKLGIGDIDQLTEALNSKVSVTGSTISGLDADLVDGFHGSQLAKIEGGKLVGALGAQTTAGVQDWNNVSNTRGGMGKTLLRGDMANGPSGSSEYYHAVNYEYNSSDGNGQLTQFAVPYSNVDQYTMWMRSRFAGTWTAWTKFWHAGNDGPGSGLDADTVDGYQLDKLLRRTPWIAHPGHDADTMTSGEVGFTYANNAPHVGPIVRMGINGYDMELNGSYGHGAGYLAFRMRNGDNATWHEWREFWHSGNDGSGSGLNADLLDGIEGSQFVRSDASDKLYGGYGSDLASLGSLSGTTLSTNLNTRGRNFCYGTNNGAFTITAPTDTSLGNSYSMVLLVGNSSNAGAITFSGFDKVDSDELTTTNGHWFMIFITKITTLEYAIVKRIVG